MSETTELLAQAERCFRLANGPVGPRLAEELEGLGHAFKREAEHHEVSIPHRDGSPAAASVTKIGASKPY
jgi:hypothetical protein